MVIFHSYVKLPEGISSFHQWVMQILMGKFMVTDPWKKGCNLSNIWARSHFSLLNGPGNGMEIADLNWRHLSKKLMTLQRMDWDLLEEPVLPDSCIWFSKLRIHEDPIHLGILRPQIALLIVSCKRLERWRTLKKRSRRKAKNLRSQRLKWWHWLGLIQIDPQGVNWGSWLTVDRIPIMAILIYIVFS